MLSGTHLFTVYVIYLSSHQFSISLLLARPLPYIIIVVVYLDKTVLSDMLLLSLKFVFNLTLRTFASLKVVQTVL